jgi:hypothetical protein
MVRVATKPRSGGLGWFWWGGAGWVALALLGACDPVPKLAADPAVLTASTPGSVPAAPDCASCHAYPLHDVNHQYHLISANVNRNNLGQPELNNVTTCLDCHYNSIRAFRFTHADTVWGDSTGQELFQHTSPSDIVLKTTTYQGWRPLPDFAVDTARGRFLAADIDSLIFRYARGGKMVQWRTGRAHDNGTVDVAFAPNDVTSPESLATAYKPRDLSCSAITCHNTRAATYRFMSPALGLSNCPSLDGNDPTCNETTAPAPKRSAP